MMNVSFIITWSKCKPCTVVSATTDIIIQLFQVSGLSKNLGMHCHFMHEGSAQATGVTFAEPHDPGM